MKPLQIDAGIDLSVEEVIAVACHDRAVTLTAATKALLATRRAQIEAYVGEAENAGMKAYGFNTGFGHNVRLSVGSDHLRELQRALILSHASGVGPDADIATVRATMLLRARSLSRGHSAVRPVVVETLLACLNAGITPCVPRFGSVSASGDLAPLSHVALALIGEGDVYVNGKRKKAAAALKAAGIAPLVLEMKEGLALNNGVQYSCALGILALHQFETLLKTAAIAASLSCQVMLGADTPFRADLHALRPHPGAVRAARWVHAAMKDSPLRNAHRDIAVDGEVQDPYNLRCAAQILGTCVELAERARRTLTIEANSVTDNPIILPLAGGKKTRHAGEYVDIVSGGHFHGMPIAVDIYGLMQAVSIAASVSNLRCARYVDRARNKGLGSDLKWPGDLDLLKVAGEKAGSDEALRQRQAISSALMIPEYVTASIANQIWGLAMPNHLFSIPTDAGQEDHVSMAASVAFRLHEALPRLAEALAIELAFAFQAAAIRKEMGIIPTRAPGKPPLAEKIKGAEGWVRLSPEERRLSPIGEAVLSEIGQHFRVVKEDRSFTPEVTALAAAVGSGAIVARAEAAGLAFG